MSAFPVIRITSSTPLLQGDPQSFISADWFRALTAITGTVAEVCVVAANGFAGAVASPTSTPAITIETTVTGIVKGDGTGISAASVGIDYSGGTSTLGTGILKSTALTGALSIAVKGVDYAGIDYPNIWTALNTFKGGIKLGGTNVWGIDFSGGTYSSGAINLTGGYKVVFDDPSSLYLRADPAYPGTLGLVGAIFVSAGGFSAPLAGATYGYACTGSSTVGMYISTTSLDGLNTTGGTFTNNAINLAYGQKMCFDNASTYLQSNVAGWLSLNGIMNAHQFNFPSAYNVTGTSGAATGTFLTVLIDGSPYKLALLNP